MNNLTKELLAKEKIKLCTKRTKLYEKINSDFDMLVNSIVNSKVKARIEPRMDRMFGSKSDLCYGRFEIKQIKEDGTINFYSGIDGYIFEDRITLSTSLSMTSDREVEKSDRKRFYQCVKLYDKEQKLINFMKKSYINAYIELGETIWKLGDEIDDIEREEQRAERNIKERKFFETIKRNPIIYSFGEPNDFNNYKIHFIKYADFVKETEKLVVIQKNGWKNEHIKRECAMYELGKFYFTDNDRIVNLNEEQINRLYEIIDDVKDIQAAAFNFATQKLTLGLAHNTKCPDYEFENVENLRLMYALTGDKWYLQRYEWKSKKGGE